MRKETAALAAAFKARRPCRQARSHTDGAAVFLHGIKIAEWRPNGRLAISLRGYVTNTTCDRLNGILEVCAPSAGRVFRKAGNPFIGRGGADAQPMDPTGWLEIEAA